LVGTIEGGGSWLRGDERPGWKDKKGTLVLEDTGVSLGVKRGGGWSLTLGGTGGLKGEKQKKRHQKIDKGRKELTTVTYEDGKMHKTCQINPKETLWKIPVRLWDTTETKGDVSRTLCKGKQKLQ